MLSRARLTLAAVAAAFVLALAAGGADAIEFDPAGSTTLVSLGQMLFRGEGIIDPEMSCFVTLRGTLASSILDSNGSNFGAVTNATTGSCSGGTAAFISEPWPMTYTSKNLASAPKFMSVTIIDPEFMVSTSGVDCIYEGNVGFRLELEGSPLLTLLAILNGNAVDLVDLGSDFLCPSTAFYEGVFTFTRQTVNLP